jgi:hypothetical protein
MHERVVQFHSPFQALTREWDDSHPCYDDAGCASSQCNTMTRQPRARTALKMISLGQDSIIPQPIYRDDDDDSESRLPVQKQTRSSNIPIYPCSSSSKSQSIMLDEQRSALDLQNEEVQEQQVLSDYRDYIMYSRIVDHLINRQDYSKNQYARYVNGQCLRSVIETRMGNIRNRQYHRRRESTVAGNTTTNPTISDLLHILSMASHTTSTLPDTSDESLRYMHGEGKSHRGKRLSWDNGSCMSHIPAEPSYDDEPIFEIDL